MQGNSLTVLRTIPDSIFQTCVTSPPYYGLRDYGMDGQLGLEKTVAEYVSNLVEVFREVKRVLKDDGTLWLNLGDSYAGSGKGAANYPGIYPKQNSNKGSLGGENGLPVLTPNGLKPKDLMGIPWRVAFALQDDGWYLRSDIIWNKPNAMPESVTDRPTKAHEYIFLFSKQPSYYYDHEAIKEPAIYGTQDIRGSDGVKGPKNRCKRDSKPSGSFSGKYGDLAFRAIKDMRNKRSVWTVSTKPYKEAHFATYPTDLIEPCILAGSRVDDTVLDPFFGSGTTGLVALQNNRNFIGIELNPEYIEIAKKRLSQVQMRLV